MKIITLLVLICTAGLCVSCAKKMVLPAPQNTFQARQTTATVMAKNYKLCKHCVHYTHFLEKNNQPKRDHSNV